MPNKKRLIALDAVDARILSVLQRAGRISNQQLAERIHLSPSACSRRVARLEAEGAIAGYVALMEPVAAGRGTTVFVQITLARQSEEDMAVFERAIAACPDVMECYLMSGESDYLVKVAVLDLDDYERVHAQHLARIPGVARIHSSFALRRVKKTTAFELPADGGG